MRTFWKLIESLPIQAEYCSVGSRPTSPSSSHSSNVSRSPLLGILEGLVPVCRNSFSPAINPSSSYNWSPNPKLERLKDAEDGALSVIAKTKRSAPGGNVLDLKDSVLFSKSFFCFCKFSNLFFRSVLSMRTFSSSADVEARVIFKDGNNVVFSSKDRRSNSDSFIFSESTRSEEHTSELQSQSNLVCRLLL